MDGFLMSKRGYNPLHWQFCQRLCEADPSIGGWLLGPVLVMPTEQVQQFKVCYSCAHNFFTVPLDRQ